MNDDTSVLAFGEAAGMPPRQPLAMPVQDLDRAPAAAAPPPPARRTWLARYIAFGGAALLTAAGLYEMVGVVALGGTTVLEGIMTALFAVTFGWIALAATTALAGLVAGPPPRRLPAAPEPLTTRTALVMPIYHEDVLRVAASLQAMAEDIDRLGAAHAFEIVILSDSATPDAWVRETLAVSRLAGRLAGTMPVRYRRRWANTGRKAGNIKDFVENWGGRYEHMVVLDADSLMAADTLCALAAAMQSAPRLGILQTIPVLVEGRSLFARLQQFAGRIHGPVVARGLAAWQGADGTYWGHNAIIRTAAFAAACGLPDLPGRKPFGGPILSHDFVEAALIRRAGWEVEMAVGLGGSWEEAPPSLLDVAARDRRWAQGNLQHAKVIGAPGLAWPSRVHFAVGMMSYLASPLWLALLVAGLALSTQAHFIRPEYFSEGFQLFPTWPRFDSERMIRLFLATMAVLLLPKALGLATALADRELRRGAGGALRLAAGAFAEIVLSAAYAPILMAIQSHQVFDIFAGRDSGWSAQRRGDGEVSWGEAWRRHRWHGLAGLAIAALAAAVSPAMLAWLAPVIVGLAAAPILSRLSGSFAAGDAFRRLGLLLTPEETCPHPLLRRRAAIAAAAPPLPADAVAALIADAEARAAHFERAAPPPRRRGAPDPAYLTATEKIREAGSQAEALAWLNDPERLHVAATRPLVEQLARLPANSGGEDAVANRA